MPHQKRNDTLIFAALAVLMLLTRTHSVSQVVHLPDTSWASFFVLGYYLRSGLAFAALFLLGFVIDLVMIRVFGTSNFCFTAAYGMLVPAYGVMWLAGRWFQKYLGARQHLAVSLASLPLLAVVVSFASLIAELLSSGGFYAFSGRFAAPTLAGFMPRLALYFPYTLSATLTWTAVAVAVHVGVMQLRGASQPHRR